MDGINGRNLRRVMCPGVEIRRLPLWMGRWCRLSGIPSDAVIIAIEYERETDYWHILIQSQEFTVIPEGQIIPEIALMIETGNVPGRNDG